MGLVPIFQHTAADRILLHNDLNQGVKSCGSECFEVKVLKSSQIICLSNSLIPETVLAIVDNGNISASDFETIGLFMTEEERQEEIENFKYFDEEEQDYYVGKIEERRYPNHYLMEYAMDRIDDYSGGGGGGYSSTYTRTGAWKIKEQVPAMLDTKWHQRSPFNDMCPERKKHLRLFGPKKKAPAGCVPLAVSQIMAYHEYPTHFTYNGIYVN